MLFSMATAYGLQALAVLPEDGEFRLAKDLAGHLGLPGPYLAKILQNLAQANILESSRGPRGGFRLAKPASRITVGQVMKVLEGPGAWDGCLMGFPHCGKGRPCPLHETWSASKKQLEATVAKTSIQDLQCIKPRKPRRVASK